MTEMSPLGTVCTFKTKHPTLDSSGQYAVQAKQGHAVFGVDMKLVDDAGAELHWDGKSSGELLVRGPRIVSDDYKGDGGHPLVRDAAGQGWFPTGDVSLFGADGVMQVTDRSKDAIKSGGEWIDSIDLEIIAMAMAACIAVFHPKWDEWPLRVVVTKPNAEWTREELLAFYDARIAKWWTPQDMVFVEAIPPGATGKMQNNKLRAMFKGHQLPTA